MLYRYSSENKLQSRLITQGSLLRDLCAETTQNSKWIPTIVGGASPDQHSDCIELTLASVEDKTQITKKSIKTENTKKT